MRFPASRKVYVEAEITGREGERTRLKVPFREIELSPSRTPDGTLETNEPIRVYDTSGPWTDP
ncbi:hypothetical protein OFB74_34010, partial [Escherichia coli]|nr:hypothetical protein [Escherichia coli]